MGNIVYNSRYDKWLWDMCELSSSFIDDIVLFCVYQYNKHTALDWEIRIICLPYHPTDCHLYHIVAPLC